MFKLFPLAENTHYLKCYSNIGVYTCSDGEAILIDSGDHKKSFTDLDNALSQKGLRVKTIFNTHGHNDHVAGNKFFRDKYGCDIYSGNIEYMLMQAPNIDMRLLFNGLPIKRDADGNIPAKHMADAKLLTKEVLPDGFDIAPLPGHTFNMYAVKTPDDVWFIGDAVLAKETFDIYKIPFCLGINKTIETAKKLTELKGRIYVPSHAEPQEDITELANYNVERLLELKEYFYGICEGKSFETIFKKADDDLDLMLNMDKYAKIGFTIKSILTALLEDGRITAKVVDGNVLYSKAELP